MTRAPASVVAAMIRSSPFSAFTRPFMECSSQIVLPGDAVCRLISDWRTPATRKRIKRVNSSVAPRVRCGTAWGPRLDYRP
jgi:hypothetical protein